MIEGKMVCKKSYETDLLEQEDGWTGGKFWEYIIALTRKNVQNYGDLISVD